MTALLDPNRDKTKWPVFNSVLTGTTEATGTFYAVTEYKGRPIQRLKREGKKKVPPQNLILRPILKKQLQLN